MIARKTCSFKLSQITNQSRPSSHRHVWTREMTNRQKLRDYGSFRRRGATRCEWNGWAKDPDEFLGRNIWKSTRAIIVDTARSTLLFSRPSRFSSHPPNSYSNHMTRHHPYNFSIDSILAKKPSQIKKTSQIRVFLQSSSLWRQFHSLGTEMIVTKSGR